MKNFFTLGFFALVLVSCGPEKSVQIKGSLSGANTEKIILNELGKENASRSDTVQLDEKGNFSFKHKISQPTFYSLTVNSKAITLLAHPGEKIVISGDAHHLPSTYSVDGSDDSQNIRRLSHRLERIVFIGDSLDKTLEQFEGNRNFVNIQRQLEWNYKHELDSLRAYNIRFINKNPQSLVVIYALYQQLSKDIPVFYEEEDIKYFRKADSTFYKRYPKVPFVNTLHANVLRKNDQYNARRLNRMLSLLGQNAPEIALQSSDGKMMTLSDYKGKYVLVDFWASWSASCRTENVKLLNIYNKYHDQGFEVFQISLDQSKSSWERAIKEDGLPWINVNDFKVWDSEVVKLYGVETIPASFLVDQDGSIITKNLKGDALDKRLSDIFTATE